MTQKELARKSGLSQSHISDIELGTKSPSLQVFETLCNALKVHPHELLDIIEK